MNVTIYHNPRCGKSRDTLALLQRHGVEPIVIEYLKTPPTVSELKSILRALGMKAADLARKKEAAEAHVDLNGGEDAILCAMVQHPILIERPIVVRGDRAVLGRPPENVKKLLDQ